MSEKSVASSETSQGNDLRYMLKITFEEAANGCQKSFDINRLELCSACHGTGKKQQGNLLKNALKFFSSSAAGSCEICNGKGRIEMKRNVSIKIPAGINSGQTIVMNKQGHAGLRGAPNGDLYILIGVKTHENFWRNNYDLLIDIPISSETAAQGGEIEVPTLDKTNPVIKY